MKFGIAAEKVRRLIATVTNPIGAPLRTAGRLPFFGAVKALAAGGAGVPGDPVADSERLARPILFQPISKLFDSTDRLVAENDRQSDRQFAFPQMNIGAADAGHF